MDTANLYHKLHLSVKHLATGRGLLKLRLEEIYKSYLTGLKIDGSSEAEALLREAKSLATSIVPELKSVGTLHYSLQKNHSNKNQKIATLIFHAYELVSHEYH